MSIELSEIEQLANALQSSIESKNTISTKEFKQFHPLFKKDTDTNTKEYRELCEKWSFRVSLYHPINVVNNETKKTVLKLPPMFNRVNPISNVPIGGTVINKLDHALATNHPLRTDVEEAINVFKDTVALSQDKEQLDNSATKFAEIASNAGFKPENTDDPDIKGMIDDLEWT
jgi:hypothetical protein